MDVLSDAITAMRAGRPHAARRLRQGAWGLRGLLDTGLLYILRAWYDQHAKHTTGWAAALRDPAIGQALSAIHHDPARPWTVEELGTVAGLSRAAFAKRFTAFVGEPPLGYLTWWRLTLAGHL